MTPEQVAKLGGKEGEKTATPALVLARPIDKQNIRDRVGAQVGYPGSFDHEENNQEMQEDSLQDVRQDQMTEFLGIMRCAACIRDDRKCWIRKSDDACLLCSSTREPCLFTRTVLKTGPKNDFPWANLTGSRPTAQHESPRQ